VIPDDRDLLYKRARAYSKMREEKEAVASLDRILSNNAGDKKALEYKHRLSLMQDDNSFGVGLTTDHFSDVYDSRQFYHFQVGKTTKYGSIIGTVNYSPAFGENNFQYELDMYPRISDGLYCYLNYGYSVSTAYPKHRFGGEIYKSLPHSLESSIGTRILKYGDGDNVFIYTGSLGLYNGNYYLSLRPYITPGDVGVSKSGSLTIRRYGSSANKYLFFRLSMGYSPESRSLSTGLTGPGDKDYFYLKSQSAAIGYNFILRDIYIWKPQFKISHQELSFDAGNYIRVYSFSLSLRIKYGNS
jgi:YaiO family outer membrane protein